MADTIVLRTGVEFFIYSTRSQYCSPVYSGQLSQHCFYKETREPHMVPRIKTEINGYQIHSFCKFDIFSEDFF